MPLEPSASRGLELTLAVTLAVAGLGCAASPPMNRPLDDGKGAFVYDPRHGYRMDTAAGPRPGENPNSLFVGLAASGGGTRAAAFTYGVLRGLRGTKVMHAGHPTTLLDELDVISSVSGGSFPAAYYGLFRERLFDDFPSKFLYADIEGQLVCSAVNPANWPKLAYGRTDIAADLYGPLFENKTFAALPRRRPFIVLNATNMTLGARFTFTQEQFDVIGSDLDSFPIARGVAASSAFPGLLTPMTLQNFGAPAAFPYWKEDEKAVADDRDRNLERYRRAADELTYRARDQHPYIHLMDGGLADNLGARHFIDSIQRGRGSSGLLTLLQKGEVDTLVLVLANANNAYSMTNDLKVRAPGLVDVLMATGSIAMDNYTAESAMRVETTLRSFQREMMAIYREQTGDAYEDPGAKDAAVADCRLRFPVTLSGAGGAKTKIVTVYLVSLSFLDVPDRTLREKLLAVSTSFSIGKEVADEVAGASEAALKANPCFRDLIAHLP